MCESERERERDLLICASCRSGADGGWLRRRKIKGLLWIGDGDGEGVSGDGVGDGVVITIPGTVDKLPSATALRLLLRCLRRT